MRISGRTGDRGYIPFPLWEVDIRLDGKHVEHCVVADDDAGYVIRAVVYANTGKPFFNPFTEKYELETVYGHVSIQRRQTQEDSAAMGNACNRTRR